MASSANLFKPNKQSKSNDDQVKIQCTKVTFDYGVIKHDIGGKKYQAHLRGSIYLPLAEEENPYVDIVYKENIEWLVSLGLTHPDHASYKKIVSAKFAALFATPLRHLSKDHLSLLAMFVSFLFIFDDLVDKYPIPKTEKEKNTWIRTLRTVTNVFTKIFKGEIKDLSQVKDNDFPHFKKFCSALFDIRKGMVEIIKQNQKDKKNLNDFSNRRFAPTINIRHDSGINPNDFCDYFFDELKVYFDALDLEQKQSKAHETHINPQSVADYLAMRKTGATQLSVEFIALIRGTHLPKEVRRNPAVEQKIFTGTSTLNENNDFVSEQKELEEPNHLNITRVSVMDMLNQQLGKAETYQEKTDAEILKKEVWHTKGTGILFDATCPSSESNKNKPRFNNVLQEAIDASIALHNRQMCDLLFAEKLLGKELFKEFKPYHEILLAINKDNDHWSNYVTDRYEVPEVKFKHDEKEVALVQESSGKYVEIQSEFKKEKAQEIKMSLATRKMKSDKELLAECGKVQSRGIRL